MEPSTILYTNPEQRERLARFEARDLDHRVALAQANDETRALARSAPTSPEPGRLGSLMRRLLSPWLCPDGTSLAD
jgi:hypothetical protein